MYRGMAEDNNHFWIKDECWSLLSSHSAVPSGAFQEQQGSHKPPGKEKSMPQSSCFCVQTDTRICTEAALKIQIQSFLKPLCS